MKKICLLVFSYLFCSTIVAQYKILTKTGTTTFEASVPSFEEVKGVNKNSGCILNTKTGEIVGLIIIKGFKFKLALMEEHFNENYMESNKYPKAIFKGKIINFDKEKITDTPQQFEITGTMDIHGATKEIRIPTKIYKKGNTTIINASFSLNTDDYNITLPLLVRSKVTKKVDVTIHYELN